MASRNVCLLVVVHRSSLRFSGNLFSGPIITPSGIKQPPGSFLDSAGKTGLIFGSANRGQGKTTTTCVSCHSLLPYALARPALRRISDDSPPTKLETKILEQTKDRVANWDRLDAAEFQLFYDFDEAKKKQSRGTEAILNALILRLMTAFRAGTSRASREESDLDSLGHADYHGHTKVRGTGLTSAWIHGNRQFALPRRSVAAIAAGAMPGNGWVPTSAIHRNDPVASRLPKHEFRDPEPA